MSRKYTYPVWPTTPEGWCAYFKALDKRFGTTEGPLHHDSRCDCGKGR